MSREFFYILAQDAGRTVLIGPFDTPEEARGIAWKTLDGYFQVIELPTRDRARATQIIKARKLVKTEDLSESIEPVKHVIEKGKGEGQERLVP